MLEATIMIAIVVGLVVGLIAGTLYARFLRHKPLVGLAFVSAAIVLATSMYYIADIFLSLPAIVLLAVFSCVAYLVQGGLFQARPVVPRLSSMDGKQQESKAAIISNVLRWVAGTYVFWSAVSLLNFELLGFFAIPPAVVIFFPKLIGKFLPFIFPPLVVAIALGTIVTAFVAMKSKKSRHVAPLIFNFCVLFIFFASAEIFRYHLMSRSLLEHEPIHFESSSFLNSLLTYSTDYRWPHARFDENGKRYRWSYSERKFVEVP